ncbi:Galactose/methyl galactoside import ATP-binding protein MglA [Rubripirellula amarantea]|uniref:Galactose/methyl galactoside import ATP-binding protein MglA n=1 Tax=Rubripirellula amarantea TaxID=2527999 RepID=A0A5C5WUS7_9BACT|nr:sugar ABC transporter ATP-binding protein [Rubripirellula amarantea]TWT53851.1 Galactose/methyl galactoside import ATP-binding protein MglA [Rubripirellula amarantea]
MTLLQTNGLTKRYGPVTVLDQVNLDVQAGEIHGLLGANGAGKSTLCKIIAGLISPSDGTMMLSGEDYHPTGKQNAEQRGVEIIQQELNLIPTLSVAQNIFLTRLPSTAGIVRSRKLRTDARRVLERFGLDDIDPDMLVGKLGVGRQQMIEIASALDRKCQLLILDEPTAALSAGETQRLFEQLEQLRSKNVAMIYISHRLDEVAHITDRVTVLRDGKLISTHDTQDVSTDRMVELMSGDSHDNQHAIDDGSSESRTSNVALSVRNLSARWVQDISFDVHGGERFGIAGLVGSGRTELLRAIFGADVADSGTVQVGQTGKAQRFRHPADAVSAGLAMITEDRKQNGLLLSQSIRVNSTLASLSRDYSQWNVIQGRAERESTMQMIDSLDTRCNNMEQAVGTLSGGNQQKVAVSKWLLRDSEVVLFDEPTRGIDVSARHRIYELLRTLSHRGKGVVIVSSDLDELMDNCHRIAVMSAGRIVATFERNLKFPQAFDQDAIMRASFAGYSNATTSSDIVKSSS